MIWEVEIEEGQTIEMTAYEVLNVLMGKVITDERPDHQVLAQTFTEYLQANKALADISLTQLVSMAIEVGYFYRVFKHRNTVKFTEVEDEASTSKDDSTPTD